MEAKVRIFVATTRRHGKVAYGASFEFKGREAFGVGFVWGTQNTQAQMMGAMDSLEALSQADPDVAADLILRSEYLRDLWSMRQTRTINEKMGDKLRPARRPDDWERSHLLWAQHGRRIIKARDADLAVLKSIGRKLEDLFARPGSPLTAAKECRATFDL